MIYDHRVYGLAVFTGNENAKVEEDLVVKSSLMGLPKGLRGFPDVTPLIVLALYTIYP